MGVCANGRAGVLKRRRLRVQVSPRLRDTGWVAGHPAKSLKLGHAGSSPAPVAMPPRFAPVRACSWQERVARAGAGEMLHADIAQGLEHFLAKEEAPGPRPGIRSQAGLAQHGRGAWPRPRRFAVRIRGSVRKRKVNRTGAPGSPAKRCAGHTVGFECSAFRHGG